MAKCRKQPGDGQESHPEGASITTLGGVSFPDTKASMRVKCLY